MNWIVEANMKVTLASLSEFKLRALRLGIALGLAMTLLGLLGAGASQPVSARSFRVGLVADWRSVSDGGFNWASYQGLLRAQRELGVVGAVYTSPSQADYLPNLQRCVADGNDLCISVGFLTADAISQTAAANPGTLFADVDFYWQAYPANLRGITFAETQAGYMAGALAGLMTHSDVVGAVSGSQIPPVERFVEPYRRGAGCANPKVTTLITYTGSFVNPELGAQIARQMMAQRADVIFGVGGSTGSGAVLAATQSGAWGIGIDTDYYYTVFMTGTVPGADKLLTSALKRVDNAVFATIADAASGAFTSGTAVYGLAADGVGLAPFHESGPFIPSTVRGRLERIKQDLIGGSITVDGPCPPYMNSAQILALPAATTTLTGSGGLATLVFSSETFGETSVITYTPQMPVNPGRDLAGIGLFFELKATSQAAGAPIQPDKAYTLTISYLDQEVVAAQITNEKALALYYRDGNQWLKEPSSKVDSVANIITATPNHFSQWAVLSEKRPVFLPTVVRSK